MTAHTTGVLLTYYRPYVDEAVRQFESLLRSLPGSHSMVIVHNGPDQLENDSSVPDALVGDNSQREFSGWEVGLAHCRRNGLLEKSDLLVFANDTFCHHNKSGPVTRFAFRRALGRLLESPSTPLMTGEIHALGKPFSIDGLEADRWVATYLFGMSRGMTRRLERLTPASPMNDFYRRDEAGTLGFSDRISPNLARHVEHWLLGSGQTRWQGVPSTGARTLAQLQGKANSVLCEKYLSAYALARGATLLDVFASAPLRQFRRIEALPKKLAALSGGRSGDIYQA